MKKIWMVMCTIFMIAFSFPHQINADDAEQGEKQDSILLFKSGFEKGVYLEEPYTGDTEIWWQEIKGSDVDGFSWPIKIWNHSGILQMIVGRDKNIWEYIENRMEYVVGPDNRSTRALHQIIKRYDYDYGCTQDPYIIYTNGTEKGDLYIKYDLKFPSNLKELLGKDGWLTFCEWKTVDDYRLAFYVYSDEYGDLYWYVHGDSNVNGDEPYEEYWYEENRSVEVPQGKWFTVEIYWHRSEDEEGRVWWAIDGKTIVDHRGPNKISSPINAIMIFTAYSSAEYFHQWIDNIEIWNGFPHKNCEVKIVKPGNFFVSSK